MLIGFLWKACVVTVVVWAILRLAQRAGPVPASALMTLPLNAGPGFLFLAFDESDAFVRDGALIAFAATGPVVVFAAIFARQITRRALPVAFLIATLAWMVVPLLLAGVEMTLPLAAGLTVAGVLLGLYLVPKLSPDAPAVSEASDWRPAVARAAAGGVVVATVATFGGMLGSEGTGLLLGFPTTITAASWAIATHYDAAFAQRVLATVPRTIASYSLFCLFTYLLIGPLSALGAWTVAALISLGTAFAFALWAPR